MRTTCGVVIVMTLHIQESKDYMNHQNQHAITVCYKIPIKAQSNRTESINCLLNIGNVLLKNITFVYDKGNLRDGIVLMIKMIKQ